MINVQCFCPLIWLIRISAFRADFKFSINKMTLLNIMQGISSIELLGTFCNISIYSLPMAKCCLLAVSVSVSPAPRRPGWCPLVSWPWPWQLWPLLSSARPSGTPPSSRHRCRLLTVISTYGFVKEFRNFELNRGVLVLVCILLLSEMRIKTLKHKILYK